MRLKLDEVCTDSSYPLNWYIDGRCTSNDQFIDIIESGNIVEKLFKTDKDLNLYKENRDDILDNEGYIWLEFRLSQGNFVGDQLYLYSVSFENLKGNIYYTFELYIALNTDFEDIKKLTDLFYMASSCRDKDKTETAEDEINEIADSIYGTTINIDLEF